MKLYYTPGACSLAPHITLCEAGLPYDLCKVDLQTSTTEDGQAFTEINPYGYVPALQLDDGNMLYECPAIMQLVADLAPGTQLIPENGSLDRYAVLQWLNMISTELHKSLGALYNPRFDDSAREVFIDLFTHRIGLVAKGLESSDYLMGDNYSLADIYLFTVLSWCPHVDFDLSPWPSLKAYQERIGARPAVQQALQKEGLV